MRLGVGFVQWTKRETARRDFSADLVFIMASLRGGLSVVPFGQPAWLAPRSSATHAGRAFGPATPIPRLHLRAYTALLLPSGNEME